MSGKPQDPATRFWKHVDKRGPDECWEWQGGRWRKGYGKFWTTGGRRVGAHRVAFEMSVGLVGDLQVCHRCDNPPCVNPSHLFLGTNADNLADKLAKGRQAKGPALSGVIAAAKALHPESVARGERQGGARVSEDDVREMRRLFEQCGLTKMQVAKRFDLSWSQTSRILTREDWRHVS